MGVGEGEEVKGCGVLEQILCIVHNPDNPQSERMLHYSNPSALRWGLFLSNYERPLAAFGI